MVPLIYPRGPSTPTGEGTGHMPWKCPVCGHVNPDDKEFCEVCGAKKPETPEIVEAEAIKLQEQRPETQTEAEVVEETRAGEEAVEHVEAVEEAAPETASVEEAEETAEEERETVEEEAVKKLPETIYLEVVNSPATELIGKKIPVLLKVFPQVTIGRSPENVIIIPDPTVSRRHAVIKIEEDKLVLEDLGSTNGTYVYRQESGGFEKVEKIELEPGMIIRFGEQTIVRIVTEPA